MRLVHACLATAVLLCTLPGESLAYDPLTLPAGRSVATLDLTIHDAKRERGIPIRVYLPANTAPAPVILFSHGLGGSRANNPYLGEHWAGRGYTVVFLQHPGSDEAVWQDVPPGQRRRNMENAADVKNFMLRVGDVTAVLDQLGRWNGDATSPLRARLDLDRVGMSGHSFGAVTTQAVSGQRFRRGGTSLTDPRIDAALLMSPSSPRRGGTPAEAFGTVSIPWLLMTGTLDTAPIGGQTVDSRLAVFPALPPDDKYQLVLDRAEHSAFTDRPLPGDRAARNPNHHRAILALSTAFWDTYLRGDAAARAWLTGHGPRTVLDPADRWETK